MKENKSDIFYNKKCCVIVPTYNNAGTLKIVLDGILKHTHNLIVINDGSSDETKSILSSYSNLHLIENKENKGKGYALRISFAEALEAGYDYAVTIDSDAQHSTDDLPKFMTAGG